MPPIKTTRKEASGSSMPARHSHPLSWSLSTMECTSSLSLELLLQLSPSSWPWIWPELWRSANHLLSHPHQYLLPQGEKAGLNKSYSSVSALGEVIDTSLCALENTGIIKSDNSLLKVPGTWIILYHNFDKTLAVFLVAVFPDDYSVYCGFMQLEVTI